MQMDWKILLLTLLTSLSLTACSGEDLEEEPETETDQVEVSMEELDDRELLNISAMELSDEYRSNEPMSDKAFKSQRAEIQGTIHNLNELDGKDYITLSASEKEGSPLINCFFDENFDKIELNQGDEITIIGTIAGKKEINGDRNNIVIEHCKLK